MGALSTNMIDELFVTMFDFAMCSRSFYQIRWRLDQIDRIHMPTTLAGGVKLFHSHTIQNTCTDYFSVLSWSIVSDA